MCATSSRDAVDRLLRVLRRLGCEATLQYDTNAGWMGRILRRDSFVHRIAPEFFGAIVVGSSAAMLGLIVAFSMRFPNEEILLFFILPIKGRHIVPITLVVDLLVRLSGSPIAISAHWGGMLTAYLLITGRWRPSKMRRLLYDVKNRHTRRKKSVPFDVLEGGKGKDGDKWIN